MGLRKKHQNLRTAAIYGASDSHVWLDQIFSGRENFDLLQQDNMCYCSFQGEFPVLPRGILVIKNTIFEPLRLIESETKSEVKVKIEPAFIFHPLRA